MKPGFKALLVRTLPCACLLNSGLIFGQNESSSILDEITVTATRIPTEWIRLPLAVGWVDQDEIQLGRQQLGLDEALVNIPGVFSQNRYNFAQDLRISIRGFGARANFGIRGIMLISDDIPLTMPDGQGNVDSIDLGSTRSVEVIRGPVSAVYGASGGGVINIRTEDGPDIPFLAGRLSLGSYDYSLAQAKAGGQTGKANWLASLSNTQLEGYRQQSAYKRTLWNSKLRYDFDDSSSLTVVFNAVDSPEAQDAGGPDAFTILPERISREPLSPVVMGGDSQWATLVRWVLYTLILGEEAGMTRDNVAQKWPALKQRKIKSWKLAGGTETDYGKLIGATDDMGLNVISAVGNYKEMYERNVGSDSPLKIERGLNRLWSEGGLMYAPPVD